jgi:hypothetical protein
VEEMGEEEVNVGGREFKLQKVLTKLSLTENVLID